MQVQIGLDVYQLTAFSISEIKDYLDALVLNGGKRIRIFWDYTWPYQLENAGWYNSIFKQVGWWKDVGGAYDGEIFPLFTVAYAVEYGDPWNEQTFLKIREILTLCADRGIHVDNSILDGCSMKTPIDNRHQPLLQNVQHHGADGPRKFVKMDGSVGWGYGEHTGGIYGGFGGDDGSMKDIQTVVIAKVVETLNSIPGLSWRVNPGNEMARRPDGDETQEQADVILRDWHDFWISELKKNGVPEYKIFISITGENSRERVSLWLKAKYPGITEQIHGPNSPETFVEFASRYPGAEFDGDGFDDKALGYTNEYNFSMPSLEQCRKMREYFAGLGIKSYHTFNGYIEGREWQDITKAKWDELRALSGKENEPEPQPEPEPEPEPEPQPEPQPEPPTPPDSRTCFEKYIKGRTIWNWNIRRFFKCLFR